MNEVLVRSLIAGGVGATSAVSGIVANSIAKKAETKKAQKKLDAIVDTKKADKAKELGVEELTEEMAEQFKDEFQLTADEVEGVCDKSRKVITGATIATSALVAVGGSAAGYFIGDMIMNNNSGEEQGEAAIVGGYLMPSILR
jgi:serine protease inhibitor ecotin